MWDRSEFVWNRVRRALEERYDLEVSEGAGESEGATTGLVVGVFDGV